ncbi:hypothetical protein ATO7_03150 [Oceanococcus atlanticus]|uniref:AB hydrolase-1 domain-containing protein n=1 Tax=Oceanococcus atlanticus TaxID=1317117 RepID=A0A1Y1SI15_9GAMM|nr:alpha/beta fold hydrolase [Oceanococcus atlanticus]ORE88839.1 hypothetical protein ATO7_03150 [Oceanococcus atlanticus]
MADSPSNWQPPWLQLPGESRALIEWLRKPHAQAHPEWPQGQGIPVLVIPGFGQSAKSTTPLRKLLKAQGFVPYDWAQGRNMGLKSGMTAALLRLISTLHEKHQHKLALIGWSLGGVIARELARKQPGNIAHVMSLGSPLAGGQATTLDTLFSLINRKPGPKPGHNPERYQPPPVRCTAIYTRSDGIVNWRASCEPTGPNTENIEVRGSHLGLGVNPQVWHAICHRLSPTTRDLPYLPD